MKNIKVTYKYENPSRILSNLMHDRPEPIDTIEVYEFQNLTEDTANKIVLALGKFLWVIDYKMTDYEPQTKKLSMPSVG